MIFFSEEKLFYIYYYQRNIIITASLSRILSLSYLFARDVADPLLSVFSISK